MLVILLIILSFFEIVSLASIPILLGSILDQQNFNLPFFNKEYNDNKVKDDALVYHWITFTFNRENMIYGMLPYVPSAGSCEIMDSSKLWSDLDSMNDRVIKYQAHNQKVLEAERKKSEEKKKF